MSSAQLRARAGVILVHSAAWCERRRSAWFPQPVRKASDAVAGGAGTVEECDLVGVADVCTDLAGDFGRQTLRSTTRCFPVISKEEHNADHLTSRRASNRRRSPPTPGLETESS